MYKRLALPLMCALLAGGASAQSLSARSLTVTAIRDVAYVNQVGGGASAHIAPLSSSKRGYSSLKFATAVGSPGALPIVGVPTPVEEYVALEMAAVWADTHMPSYTSQVGSWLKGKGVGMAYYTFSQPIVINSTIGGLRPKKISFVASIDSGGHASWGYPKIVDDNPLVLDVRYTPKKGTDYVPDKTSWQYPDPGRLQWQVMDESGSPQGEWVFEPSVNGDFDPKDSVTGVDTMGQVPCLADRRNAGCKQGLPDVKDLMNATGASFGRITFLRPVEPTFQDAGDGTLMPRGAINITYRRASCDKLTEAGTYAFELDLRADQFSIKPSIGMYRVELIGQIAGLGGSPTESYSVTIDQDNAEVWPYGQDQPTPWADLVASPLQSDDMHAWLMEDADRMELIVGRATLQTTEDLTKCPRNRSRDAKDPVTGWRIDPVTGWPVDPDTDLPVDPATLVEPPMVP